MKSLDIIEFCRSFQESNGIDADILYPYLEKEFDWKDRNNEIYQDWTDLEYMIFNIISELSYPQEYEETDLLLMTKILDHFRKNYKTDRLEKMIDLSNKFDAYMKSMNN